MDPGVVTPYTKVGHRRVLKFQKDPYFTRFQGQFLKNYPLFCVKTRTILLSKIPLFLPIQGHFKKKPYLCKNNTEITQVPRRFRLKASPERGFYRDLSHSKPAKGLGYFFIFITATQISFDTHNSVRYLCHL